MRINPAVQERVNARAANRHPQTHEEGEAVVFERLGVGVEVRQEVVQIERHPADSKHHHHRDQKLDALTFGTNLTHALVLGDVPQLVPHPKLVDDPYVRHPDDR